MEINQPPITSGWRSDAEHGNKASPTWAMWFTNIWRVTRIPPAFSAYQSAAQTVTASVQKVQFQTIEFDTLGVFDATTNYRYLPTREGYYQFTGSVQLPYAATANLLLYKNGAVARNGSQTGVAGSYPVVTVTSIVYMNGVTDYVEIFLDTDTAGTLIASPVDTYFQGCMISRV